MFFENMEQRELWDERAAIYEYEGGLTRAEAEKKAYEDVQKIDINTLLLPDFAV